MMRPFITLLEPFELWIEFRTLTDSSASGRSFGGQGVKMVALCFDFEKGLQSVCTNLFEHWAPKMWSKASARTLISPWCYSHRKILKNLDGLLTLSVESFSFVDIDDRNLFFDSFKGKRLKVDSLLAICSTILCILIFRIWEWILGREYLVRKRSESELQILNFKNSSQTFWLEIKQTDF